MWRNGVDHNPHLKTWKKPEPNQIAGKGSIERPDMVDNLVHQTRSSSPTEYENQLGQNLMEIFESGAEQLPEIIQKLNERGVKSPAGEPWTEESFKIEIKRLGA